MQAPLDTIQRERAGQASKVSASPSFESWRSIPGYDGLYEVSDLGKVRSVDRVISRPAWTKQSPYLRPGALMSPGVRPDGRYRVNLSAKGRKKNFYVHLLVLSAFVGPCPEGMEGCHNDGNPANNSLGNLRYDTPAANAADRRRHGTCFGRKYARLKVETVVAIKTLAASGCSLNGIARQLGVDPSTVRKIVSGKRRVEVVVS